MLKFYNLRTELIKSVLEGLDDAKIDFPFRVSPSEQRIIEMEAPTSIILVGKAAHIPSKLLEAAPHLAMPALKHYVKLLGPEIDHTM